MTDETASVFKLPNGGQLRVRYCATDRLHRAEFTGADGEIIRLARGGADAVRKLVASGHKLDAEHPALIPERRNL